MSKTSTALMVLGVITFAACGGDDPTDVVQEDSDDTAPAAVTDLATGTVTTSSVQLSWTAPGDDGATGTANSYDVRYSTSTITAGNWATATQANGEPSPQIAGSAETFTVTLLSASTTYYFAIKTSDEVVQAGFQRATPNESVISNVPSAATSSPETLVLSFTGLDPLENGYHYEGWAIIAGAAVTTGKFNVDANGGLVTTTGSAITEGVFDTGIDLTDATAIVITIEPNGDTDAVPASTHIVAGPVSGASAALSVGDGSALGDDFTAASGSYILATPTNGDGTNENSGIWFLSLATGSPLAGLDLPTLPTGWA